MNPFRINTLTLILLLSACGNGGGDTPCNNDNTTSVDTSNGCLQLITSKKIERPRILWVILHGDGSNGGQSSFTTESLSDLAETDSVAVGMIRPGYFTRDSRTSTGPDSDRRFDHYTEDVVATLASGLSILKAHYQPEELIVIGHSGGAALTALISSFYPDLIDRSILVACPCNVPEWRVSRRGTNTWLRSLSPHDYINDLSASMPIAAIVGEDDSNTYPQLSIDYVALAQTAGVMATQEVLPSLGHNDIISNNSALKAFIRQWVNN